MTRRHVLQDSHLLLGQGEKHSDVPAQTRLRDEGSDALSFLKALLAFQATPNQANFCQ